MRRTKAQVLHELLTREWFGASMKPAPDRVLSLLMIKVYMCAQHGVPLSKKDAWQSIGIEDVRTGRKYISRAEQLGLLKVTRSKKDRRRELLLPSESLRLVMEHELETLKSDLRRYTAVLEPDAERIEEIPPCPVCSNFLRCEVISVQIESSGQMRSVWKCADCDHSYVTTEEIERKPDRHEKIMPRATAREPKS
jgi:hypothetical protein